MKLVQMQQVGGVTESLDTQRGSAKQRIQAQVLALLGPKNYQTLRNYARRLRLFYSQTAFRKHVVRCTYSGIPLSVHIEDSEAAKWYSRDWPEMEELSLLSSSRLKAEALVFDIGAHQGVVAMILGKSARRVVAVEANPHCADVARRNILVNQIENVEVVHAAAASKPGTLTFAGGDHVGREEGGEGKCTVAAVTIDELSSRYGTPDVLFIDVEGYEVEVLRGAPETLRANPDIFMEVHTGCGLEAFGGSVEQILEFLHGYELFISAPFESFVAVPMNESLLRWANGKQILANRFFMVALNRSRAMRP